MAKQVVVNGAIVNVPDDEAPMDEVKVQARWPWWEFMALGIAVGYLAFASPKRKRPGTRRA